MTDQTTNQNNENKMDKDCPMCKVSDQTIEQLKQSGQANKEKYLAKREKKQKEKMQAYRQRKNKKMLKIILPIALVAVVITAVVLFTGGGSVAQVNSKIEISQAEYDAGSVSIKGGLVKNTYEIKNTGTEDLKIFRVWTSCMCTTAKLRVGDKESKEFGMHDNPLFWSENIAPGETGYLDVSFDPAFHGPTGMGNMIREVYLNTNDPNNKTAKVRLLITVTP